MSNTVDVPSRYDGYNIKLMAQEANCTVGEVEMLLNACPEEHQIENILAYRNAIALVELREQIRFTDVQRAEYALLTPSGYLFPFDVIDASNYLPELVEDAGLANWQASTNV